MIPLVQTNSPLGEAIIAAQTLAAPWFAVRVHSRAETLAEAGLRAKKYETFLPTYTDCRFYSDRIKKIEAPLFAGYIFCRLDPVAPLPVLTTQGVSYIVSAGRKPCAIDDCEIEAVRRATSSGCSAKPWPYLREGQRVRVRHGAMAGVEGIFLRAKGAGVLVLSVHLLQRSVSIEMDRTWVRPV
ncbi:MAG TPA: transcription termination/antitermination NusG family protein [Bryobacteraceae bacterium]|nr:transcription termination/antitermination NusG family protein [Bryobacteraceae bacterium]